MLAVAVEDQDVLEAPRQEVAQAGLDGGALALVALVPDQGCAGFAGFRRGFISRSVIDHEDVVELRKRSTGNVLDMGRLEICRNQRGHIGPVCATH